MLDQLIAQVTPKLEAAFQHLTDEVGKLRTGRAHPAMLDSIMVEAYGVSMPLKQVASVSAPEAQTLQIRPFDVDNLQAIANAIRDDQSLNLNPVDDGIVIRLSIPALTTERRTEIVKQLGKLAEDCLVTMRNHRHDLLKQADLAKKDKKITQDDYVLVTKRVDELMNQYKIKIDELVKSKEKDLMSI